MRSYHHIILDGENAWEYFDHGGRPFLRELYHGISQDTQTKRSHRQGRPAPDGARSHRLYPSPARGSTPISTSGSGRRKIITRGRSFCGLERLSTSAESVPQQQRDLAFQELLIAEGGPELVVASSVAAAGAAPSTIPPTGQFDQLYRSPPRQCISLSEPDAARALSPDSAHRGAGHGDSPSSAISPTIDGEVTSYFEWMGAGVYRAEERSGAMHGKKFLIDEVQYGSDESQLYVRIDFHGEFAQNITAMELRLTALAVDSGQTNNLTVSFTPASASARGIEGAQCGFARVLELRIPSGSIGVAQGPGVRFQLSVWETGLPMDAVPQQGWIEVAV